MIEFSIRDRDNPAYHQHNNTKLWRLVRRTGYVYTIEGKEVELFTVGVLAEALDRTVQTIVVKWEKAGLIPKPLFDVRAKGKAKRWYSGQQVTNLHNLWFYKYDSILGPKLNPAFFEDVKTVFYHWHAVVVDKSGVIKQ